MLGMAAAVIAGAALGGSNKDVASLAYLANLINIARISDYGKDAETDADRTAVAYLAETKYNPVGMLTFMERLALDEIRTPQIEYGIFRTHPRSYLRADAIIEELTKRNIPVNRRLVTKYMRVEVKPVGETGASSVWIGDTEVIRLADKAGEKSSARAEQMADKLGSLLLAGAGMHDVTVGGGSRYVIVMGEVLVAPADEDAKLAGTTVEQVTVSAANAIKRALLKERLGRT
jgi:hypothetical protein